MVERIRTLLESRQLTPTQFADLIGVARPIISHILSGRNKPSLDVVQRILGAMPDLSMAWLLNGTEPMLTPAPAIAPAPLAPRPAAAPAHAAALPIPAVQPPAPTPATTSASSEIIDKQQIVSQAASFAAKPTAFAQPVMPAAAAPAVAAGVGTPTQPVSAAPRPPMPRRFPVKPVAAVQPAPDVAPAASISVADAPVASSAPAAATFSLPDAPPTSLANAEAIANENVSAPVTVQAEPRGTTVDTVPNVVSPQVTEPVLIPAHASPLSASIPGAATPPPSLGPAVGSAPIPAPTLANDMASALFTGAEKPIRRIVIFYRDGSFADYQPE
ncbi:hypothetical protein GCM10027594_22480 [Hymenobacter agri]